MGSAIRIEPIYAGRHNPAPDGCGECRRICDFFPGRFVSVMQTQQRTQVAVAAEVFGPHLHFWIKNTRLYQTRAGFGL